MHPQEVVVHVIRYTKTVLKSTMMGLRRSLLTQRVTASVDILASILNSRCHIVISTSSVYRQCPRYYIYILVYRVC